MRRSHAALALAVVLASVPAPAPAAGDGAYTVRLEGWWGGVKAADIALGERIEGGRWSGSLQLQAVGLVRWLASTSIAIEAQGAMGSVAPQPESFAQRNVTRKSVHVVELAFAGDPAVGHRVRDLETYADSARPPKGMDATPELPEAMRAGTVDPLTAILGFAHRALAGERAFTLAVFDGKHRYDLAVTVTGHARHRPRGTESPEIETIDAVAIVHPLAGFKPIHLRIWTDARFELWLDPATGLPLKIASDGFRPEAVLRANALCPPATDCTPPPAK